MRAAQLIEIPSTELQLANISEPEVGPSSVMVALEACGICGTDLHIMEGSSYRPDVPFTLGHEPVGIVTAVGPEVDDELLGRRVVPTIFLGCSECVPCRSGDERLCENGPSITGVNMQPGGFAQRMVLMARQLLEVPSNVTAQVAATLVDAGPTAHNAVRVALAERPEPAGRHLVVGAGPIGFLVAELLRHRGHHPVIIESNPNRYRLAKASGYEVASSHLELEGRFSSVIDCAGAANLVDHLLAVLIPHGIYVSVGYAPLHNFDLPLVSHRELVLRGVRSGRRSDLEEILRLVADGKITPPLFDAWPLEEINVALHSLRAGLLGGKAIVVFNN
jgi:2-desacetyl-2-hydroxyethyl bacteriochlorophyllide A dehydrogenase